MRGHPQGPSGSRTDMKMTRHCASEAVKCPAGQWLVYRLPGAAPGKLCSQVRKPGHKVIPVRTWIWIEI